MNILDLADLLLSPDEKKELQTSMELLESSQTILRFMKAIGILLKAFYSLKRLRSFWTFQRRIVLIKNVFAPLFSVLTVMVSRSGAMRMI